MAGAGACTGRAARSAVAGGPVRGGGRMNAAAPNAMTSGHAWPPSLQRSLAMFRACAPRPAVRVLCLVAVALLVTGAVLIAVYAPRPERGAIGAGTLVSFAITAPWAVWGPQIGRASRRERG